MARLALTVGGGLLGTAIPGVGNALGWAIGSAIGGTLAQALFPPPPTYGPRPDDTSVAPGTYGSPAAIVYGLNDVACDLIWVEGNEIKVRENKQSVGGKGLGGPTHVTYEQFATFAVLICDGPITGLRRLWFGKKLVYDGTAEALQDAITAGDPLPLTGALEGISFRLYTGTADQDPDPAIQAEDPHAPAWRGMSYMVFEDVPLEKWGNQIPADGVPVIAEVTAGDPSQFKVGMAVTASGNALVSYDPARKRLFVPTGDIEVRVYDAMGGVLERAEDLTGIENVWKSSDYGPLSLQADTVNDDDAPGSQSYNHIGPAVAPDGSFHVITEDFTSDFTGSPRLRFASGLMVDSETGQWLATLSTGRTFNDSDSHSRGYGFSIGHGTRGQTPTDHKLREVDWLTPDPLTGLRRYLYLRAQNHGGGFFGPVGLSDRGAVDVAGGWKITDANDSLGNASAIYVDVNAAGDTIYALYKNDSSVWKLARIPISGPRGGDGKTEFWGLAYEPDLTAAVTDFPDGGVKEMFYDRGAAHIVCRSADAIVIVDTDLNEVARLDGLDFNSDGVLGRNDAELGKMWFFSRPGSFGGNVSRLRSVSTEDAAVVDNYPLSDWGLSEQTDAAPVFEVGPGVFLGYAAAGSSGSPVYENQPFLLFRDRFGLDKIPLADVLLDIAERAGLTADDLDLAAVTTLVWGQGHKAKQVTARGAIEDLLRQTGHYAVLSGGKITVKPLATSSSGILNETALGADGRPPIKRESDSSDPVRRVELSYKSVPANLEPATQADEFPVAVVPHGKVLTFDTAMRMDDGEAWAAVQRFLTMASSERIEIEAHIPYTEDVEPGEIWTLSSGGKTYDVRVDDIDGGVAKKLRGRSAWPFISASGSPVDSTRPAPTLAAIPATDFVLLDSAIWRDEDDGPGVHVVGWPRRTGGDWDGAVVYRSLDPVAGTAEWALITAAATVGQATTALGDVPSCAHWDRANTLTVWMQSGTPSSATELEVLAGANPIWVACGQTGEWEMLQYATAAENADGSWTLSDLLRGRNGTEHLTGDHTVADRVVWASADTATRHGGDSIGTELFYVSASIGSTQNATTQRALTNRARSLRPYSPASVASSRDGSDNISATITRRSRLQGDPANTLRPLGEDSEAYEIDVLDGPGGAVLRTIEATGTDTFSYSAADQTTDFGSVQAAVDVAIHQMSGTVGRGVALETVI